MDDNTHYDDGASVDVDAWWCICGLAPGGATVLLDLLWWIRR